MLRLGDALFFWWHFNYGQLEDQKTFDHVSSQELIIKAGRGGVPLISVKMTVDFAAYGSVLSCLCGVAVGINFIMITVFLLERRVQKTYNLTYMNLSVSDLLWSLYGAVIAGPGIELVILLIELLVTGLNRTGFNDFK